MRDCTKWKVFIGSGWGKGASNKRGERIIFRRGHLLGERKDKSFCYADCFFFLWRMKRAHVTDNLIGSNQEILDWLIKIIFLEEVETAVRY